MPASNVFVISDLHIGGADGFEICPVSGQRRLVAFFDWLTRMARDGQDVHLVINGDIVDFLAERNRSQGFDAFTADDDLADWKLAAILNRTVSVWEALAKLVSVGAHLTLLLGNHDIELSLPRPRRRLLDRLGPGRVDFLYDNQALTIGGLLVEHGNRYDAWNAVDHEGLRQVRSLISRRQSPPAYEPPPGSRLVTKVINRLKESYRFVDLLKPETASVLPLLSALRAAGWRDVARVIRLGAGVAIRATGFDRDGQPLRDDLIAGGSAFPRALDVAVGDGLGQADLDAVDAANELSSDRPGDDLAPDLIAGGPVKPDTTRLLRALRFLLKREARTFDTGFESQTYLRPAAAMAARGYEAVVFGHTHLAKSVALDGGARYLNCGTWADLMCLPAAVIDGPEELANAALATLLDDLRENRLGPSRRQVATYACVRLDDGGAVRAADVRFFSPEAPDVPLSTLKLGRLLTLQ